MAQSGGMASALDPDRWNEFARPSPPPPRVGGEPSRGLSLTSGRRPGVQSVIEVINLGGTDHLPIAVVASLVGQMAQASLAPVEARNSAEPRSLDAEELLTLPVAGDGVVRWPGGARTSSEALLMVLREAAHDHGLPPELARILLARPVPEIGRIADVLGELGSVEELARWLGGALAREVSNSTRPAAGSPRSSARAQAPRSPMAARGSRRSQMEERGVGAAGTPEVSGDDSTNRLVREFLARPKRIIAGIAVAAIAVVVVLSGLVGGASASSSPVAGESPHPTPEPTKFLQPNDSLSSANQTPQPPPERKQTDEATPISWAAVLADLDAKRQRLFESGDIGLLVSYARKDSPAARRDSASHEELTALGARAKGVSAKIQNVSLLGMHATSARLDVTDELRGYRVVRADSGELVEELPPRPTKRWVVELEKVDGRWLLVDAQPATDPSK